MKCISLFGNFFLNNLGTGVVKTISPREERRIIKIFNILFILLISNLFNVSTLKSQDNLESIIDQKKRIEFEIGFLNRNNYLKVSKDHILVLRENESEKDLKWNFNLIDYNFKSLNDTTISLERSYFISEIEEFEDDFYLLFKRDYSNDKKYLVIKYSSEKRNIIFKEINFPLSLRVEKVLYFENYFVFLSKTNNSQNLISIYNTNNNQLKNIYEFMNYDKTILKINKINSSTFGVFVSENNLNGLKVISRIMYDLGGYPNNKIRIENRDFSIIETKFFENKYSLSILGNKKSRESIGIQFNELDDNSVKSQKVYYFENLSSLINLTNFKKNKKIRIREEFYLDSLFTHDNKILLTMESLKSDRNNDNFSNYQYIPFYNTYSGTYDKKINPKFGGYVHNYCLILSFGYDGRLFRTHAKKINELQTFKKKKYIKYIFEDDYYISIYINKGKIFISKNFNNLTAEDKDYLYEIEGFDNETIIKTETNPEGTYHLKNKEFLTYGIQNIKKIDNNRKRVFYINKIEIIN
tara:strand:+ start:10466 stop:12040 length:1575 start_codon:yes stop_codon:yes gene_type:complete